MQVYRRPFIFYFDFAFYLFLLFVFIPVGCLRARVDDTVC